METNTEQPTAPQYTAMWGWRPVELESAPPDDFHCSPYVARFEGGSGHTLCQALGKELEQLHALQAEAVALMTKSPLLQALICRKVAEVDIPISSADYSAYIALQSKIVDLIAKSASIKIHLYFATEHYAKSPDRPDWL